MKNHDAIRYIILTPARNEERFIKQTLDSVVNQTIKPLVYAIANDGSTDNTASIVKTFAKKYDFIRLIDIKDKENKDEEDRLAWAAEAVAFNEALRQLGDLDYDYIVKLDADLSFEPDYFERLLREFNNNPKLGIAGGHCYENSKDGLKLEWVPGTHVRGATKMYRKACFKQIGGIAEILGWDTIDELCAQMKGWETKSFYKPKLIHHRKTGTASGILKGKARFGEASYIIGYHPLYALARAIRMSWKKPFLFGGAAYLLGFFRNYLTGRPRIDDVELIKYLRGKQMQSLKPWAAFQVSRRNEETA